MKKIVHIVNPNGLGHLRRSIFIWNNINIKNISIRLLIDNSQEKYLSFFKPKSFISFKFLNFNGMITLSNIKNKNFVSNYFNMHKEFNNSINFQNIDLLISDNTLFDFGEFCKDYLVFGSFFWHDIIKDNNSLKEVYQNEKKILLKNSPEIYGINNFISGSLKEYDFVRNIGWLVHQKKKSKSIQRRLGILFSGGLGDMKISEINFIIDVLRKSSLEFNIYSSHKYKFINNSISFNFDKDWDKIDFMIARPGIGSISDCIENNLPILAIGENNNAEIVSNAYTISELNIGFDYVNKKFDLDFLDKLENINCDNLNLKGLEDVFNNIKNKL
jgi:hypothetical protein